MLLCYFVIMLFCLLKNTPCTTCTACTQFPTPYSLLPKKTPTHSVYSPTATLKQPAPYETVKERTQKYITRVCVFAKRHRLFTTEGSKHSKTIHNESVCFCDLLILYKSIFFCKFAYCLTSNGN